METTEITKKYVAGYVRISSSNSKKNSYGNSISIEQQKNKINEFAKHVSVKIFDMVEETCSAYTKKTPKLLDTLKRLSNLAEYGYEAVLFVYSVDRFSRNYINGMKMLTMALENNINIVFIIDELQTNEKDDIPRIFAKLGRAEDEAMMISKRIKDRCAYNKSLGWKFGKVKYGMKSIIKDGIRQFIPDTYERAVIKFIMFATKSFTDTIKFNVLFMKIVKNSDYHSDIVVFDNIIKGEPIRLSNRNIAELLNEYEVYKRDKKWSGSMINRIKKEQKALTEVVVDDVVVDDVISDNNNDTISPQNEPILIEEGGIIRKNIFRDIENALNEL